MVYLMFTIKKDLKYQNLLIHQKKKRKEEEKTNPKSHDSIESLRASIRMG